MKQRKKKCVALVQMIRVLSTSGTAVCAWTRFAVTNVADVVVIVVEEIAVEETVVEGAVEGDGMALPAAGTAVGERVAAAAVVVVVYVSFASHMRDTQLTHHASARPSATSALVLSISTTPRPLSFSYSRL